MLAYDVLASNPMKAIEKERRDEREVRALTVPQVWALRGALQPEARRTPGARGPGSDLQSEVVDFHLGTGCRIGEALAARWYDLELAADPPTVHVCGTLIEPRGQYVEKLFRQAKPKGGDSRTLVLPAHVVQMLRHRRGRTRWNGSDNPVFASSPTGAWVWPNNIRTRLRAATRDTPELAATTPHTLRRTVGTLVAHECGTDAARDHLGHSDGSVTGTFYVAKRPVAPDLRAILDRFFTPEP